MGKYRNKVDWEGMQQLVDYLELKANATDDDVKMAVKNNTTEMYREAFKRAPVDTFWLRDNLETWIENSGFTGMVQSMALYAGYQEYGTRFQDGTPHIRPAFTITRLQFCRDILRIAETTRKV